MVNNAADPPERRQHHVRRKTAGCWIFVVVTLMLGACDGDHRDHADHGDHVVTGDENGRDQATFVMADGADTVRIRTADLDGDLYRVSTPEDAGAVPSVHLDNNTVTAALNDADDTGDGGAVIVTAQLSETVSWHVRLAGGATTESVDLTGSPAAGVDLSAGTSRAEVSLPQPTGTLPVKLAGGASELVVHLAGSAPVRVRAGGGAATVVVDGRRHTGVAGGTVFEAPDWSSATDRYDIDATAGVSTLTVDRDATADE